MVNLENRTFKFRALATDYVYKKEGITWVYGSYVDGYIVNGVIESCEEYIVLENWCPVKRETVGQYTGLLDKNGKEIYEGDVLQKQGFWSWYVAFEDFAFVTVPCLRVQAVNWEHNRLSKDLVDGWEIIGNRFENPELLEEASKV